MSEELRIVVVDQDGARARAQAGAQAGQRPPWAQAAPWAQVPRWPQAAPRPQPAPKPPPAPLKEPPSAADRQRAADEKAAKDRENAAKASSKALQQTETKARATIGRLSQIGAALAAGRVGGALATGAAGVMAVLTGPVGIAAAAIAAALGVAAIAVRSFTKVVRGFAQTVEGQVQALAGFSPQVTLAQAQTELQRTMAQFRRAQAIGPELATAERLRANFETRMTDLVTTVLKAILRWIDRNEPVIDGLLRLIDLLVRFIEKYAIPFIEFIWAIFEALNLKLIMELLKKIGKNTEKEEPPADDPFMLDFMNMIPGRPGFWPEGQLLPPGPEGV